ncbi:alpha/beta hydrolase [Streptomyces cellulosae]|uniref:Alpha/beta hydrolase n=1 Tax=Streptomyces cellulosae TaxID=1968 RepID=A0ABW6JDK4_STRCE
MDVLTETHPYGEHPAQTLTIRRLPVEPIPCGIPEPRPGLLMVPGDFWTEPGDLGEWPEKFAQAGYVTLTVSYRQGPDAPWPAGRDDVLAALNWARTNAAALNLDPERIVAFGTATGGHLAASLGTLAGPPAPSAPRAVVGIDGSDPSGRTATLTVDNTQITIDGWVDPALKGFIALSAPLDPLRAYTTAATASGAWAEQQARLGEAAAALAGCTPDGTLPDVACHGTWQDMRVAAHASGPDTDAPALLVHFSDDLVPAEHAEDYRAAQLNQGATANDVQVYVVKGRGHGLDGMAAPGIEPVVRAWLNARLGASTAPTPCEPVPVPAPSGGCCGGGTCGGPGQSDTPGEPGPVDLPMPPPCGGEGPAAPAPEPAPSGGCCGGGACGGPGQSDGGPVSVPAPAPCEAPVDPQSPPPCGGEGPAAPAGVGGCCGSRV